MSINKTRRNPTGDPRIPTRSASPGRSTSTTNLFTPGETMVNEDPDKPKADNSQKALALGISLGLALGAGLGVCFGVVFNQLVMGLALGPGMGLALGVTLAQLFDDDLSDAS